jgi:UDP-N-acetylmuramoylalanine--D-glutamate ligase
MRNLNNLRVLVLGLGASGLAMARWCARCGAAAITVADTRDAPPQAAALAADVPQAQLRCGPFDAALVEPGVQLVLRSPGLSPLDPAVAAVLAAAAQRGVAVQGELDLFARALADLKHERGYAPKVLAITGTNGKTTTTAMTALLAQRAGARVGMAGNIGPTLLDTLAAALDMEPAPVEAPPLEGAAAAPVAAELAVPHAAASHAAASHTGLAADAAVEAAAAAAGDAAAELATQADAGADQEPVPGDAAAEPVAEPAAELAAEPAAEAAAAAQPDDALDLGGGPPPHLIPPPPPGPQFQHLPQVWVLELSSFQLDGVQGFEPTAAAVLNVTQDHLDWHGTMAAYAAAKARIFGNDAVMVVNRDDPLVLAMVPPPRVEKSRVKGGRSRTVHRRVLRFGLGAPQHPGDFGLQVAGGMAWLARAHPADDTPERGRRDAAADDDLHLQRLMPADALRVRGRHNAANALAALALATAAELPLAPMLHALRDYAGEPHRVEWLASIGGVDAYDDSKGTNVGATAAAITGLGADKAPARLVLVLGGDGKGQDFAPLAAPVAQHARAVALIGRDAGAIEDALRGTGVPLQRHDTLEAATRWCFAQAQPGDAVLLSPACASLDMFRNYAHRAQVFADTVRELAAEQGEVMLP